MVGLTSKAMGPGLGSTSGRDGFLRLQITNAKMMAANITTMPPTAPPTAGAITELGQKSDVRN